jgi:peroxiredoxin
MRLLVFVMAMTCAGVSLANVKVGQPAPDFSESDQAGVVHTLKDYKGKWVVLEWFNEGCPYVKKHYSSNNMQTLQKQFTAKGVNWLAVASSAAGKQGYVDPAKAKDQIQRVNMMATSLLLDSDGNMGQAFGAKTTPHMFVIDPQGLVVYAGAIDSDDSSDPKTINGAENYVVSALTAGLEGKAIKTASTRPYGCSVKY